MKLSNFNILLLSSSLFAFEFTADAGADIFQAVSPCDESTFVSLDANYSIDIVGVCEIGLCSASVPLVCSDNTGINDTDCLDQVEGELCNDGNDICIALNQEELCVDSGYEWSLNYEQILESECIVGTWLEFSEDDYVYHWSSSNDEVSFVNNGEALSTVVIPQIEGVAEIEIYLTVENTYIDNAIDTTIITVDSVIPCVDAGDEIRENCLSCLNEGSSIYNLGVGKCDFMKICEPIALICDDFSGINDDGCLDQIEGDLCNEGNNQCEFALCEIENESECVDNDGNWVPISEYHNNKSDGYYLLDPSNSYDYYNNELTYTWELPELFSIDDEHKVEIINPSEIELTKYPFILTVSNGAYASSPDTTYLKFDISAPIIPTIYAKADSGKVIINWTSEAINSVDSLTGYRDFEGFRIYKSLDGGETWGGPDDRIYYNGEAKGWAPLVQFDLTVLEDSLFCLKIIDCDIETDPTRGIRISGIDPLAPWVNLGENTGLKYTYTDNDVYNGKEYTYAVVSYDIGLRSYELSYESVANNMGVCTASDNSESMLNKESCCTANSGAWGSELDRCTYFKDEDEDSNNDLICDDYSGSHDLECNDQEEDDLCNDGNNACEPFCKNCNWEQLFDQEQDWDVTNPDHFADADGNGYASVECAISEINTVTAIPGFYGENVENISFEGIENADGIILIPESGYTCDIGMPENSNLLNKYGYYYRIDDCHDDTDCEADTDTSCIIYSHTIGNGLKSFMIVNQDDLTESVYRFEIQASSLDFDPVGLTGSVFEGYKTSDPSLYVYEINNSTAKVPVNSHIFEMIESEFEEIISKFSIATPLECNNEPWNTFFYDAEKCITTLSEILIDLPGVSYTDGLGFTIPDYVFKNFQLKFIDDLSYSSNFTDFIDGLKFRFDNSLRSYPSSGNASINSIKYISGSSIASGDPDTLEIENNDFFSVELNFGENGGAFNKRPPYSYKIKFKDTPQFPVFETSPSNVCSEEGNPGPTLLPFEVYNTTTGSLVKAVHTDRGAQYQEDDDNCLDDCGDEKWCNNGECQLLLGYKDCFWQRNENIAFKYDPVNTTETIVNAVDTCGDECSDFQWCNAGECEDLAEYTFDLKMNFAIFGGTPYDSSLTYDAGSYVRRSAMHWVATSTIAPNTEPTSWMNHAHGIISEDGCGAISGSVWSGVSGSNMDADCNSNDNLWQPVYGWLDGDEIIIEPTSWYVDGDAWIADFSQIGRKTAIDEEDLSKISVVPNPYLSHSRFDETATSRLMWFTHLPTYCYISIYTVSGGLVRSFEHNDEFSGQESWDLRSGNGDEVAPGLYIYTVESGNGSSYNEFKHIGKFAIVR